MATVESWAVDLTTIGPAYPMVGTEVVLVIIGVACWIGWHVWQIKHETETYKEDMKRLNTPEKVKRAVETQRLD